MGRIMLLTAAPGTGKSTAIQKIIKLLGMQSCGGFYTEEIKDDSGQRMGFTCVTLDGVRLKLADVYSQNEVRVGRYGIDIGGFEAMIDAMEESLAARDILIVDEIGFMQLLSEKFKDVLNKILNSEKVVIGTIVLQSHPEADEIKKNQQVELYELTLENREWLPKEIAAKAEAEIRRLTCS